MLRKQVLSKNNISNLYQSVIRDSSYSYDDSQKKIIANKIINGLKVVSSKVDEHKVTHENIKKILNQINSITLNKVKQEIDLNRLKSIPNDSGPQISQISMERDFMANPHSGVKIYDRPQATGNSFKNRSNMNNIGARRQSDVPDRDFEVNSQRDSNLLEDRLAQIQADRDTMSASRMPQRELPQELQPVATNPNRLQNTMDEKQIINNHNQPNGRRRIKESQDNYHLTNDTGEQNVSGLGNMPGSIDDVFKTEVTDIDSYQEDSRPLEARLNDLKNLRDIEIPNHGKLPEPMETRINNDKKKEQPRQQPQQYEQPMQPRQQQYEQPMQPRQTQHNVSSLNNIDVNKLAILENKLDKLNRFADEMGQTQKFQLIVDSRKMRHNKSNYRHTLSRDVDGIHKIELVNYSIPSSYYNITSHNNEFIYYLPQNENVEDIPEDDIIFEKKIFKLEYGKYTVEQLLQQLNEKTELVFSIGFNQKIKVSYDKPFKLHPTELTKENLGLLAEPDNISKEFTAQSIFDLREPSYFLLYIDNIDPSNPLAILNIGGTSFGKIELDSPVTLSQLDIRIVDEKGKLVDFQGRYHSLTFVLEARG